MWYSGITTCILLVLNRAVDPSEALKLPGVKTYIGADDIPGHNATGPVIFDEVVFASEKVILMENNIFSKPNVQVIAILKHISNQGYDEIKLVHLPAYLI